jgi:uncharacterized repeat protein (TIGR01451 family)
MSCILLAILLALCVPAAGKSLFVIADINSVPTPIHAYDLQPSPSYVVFQSAHGVPNWANGAVGLAIDSDSATLFVTYEDSNVIQLLNATTMNSTGYAIAPGAGNLAGIVYDRRAKMVYTVDRMSNQLYAYEWDETTGNLTLVVEKELEGVTLAHGLALDERNRLLYVGDMVTSTIGEIVTDNIKVFSTSDWSPVANYTVNQSVQAVALDSRKGYLYAGHSYPGYGSKGWLIKLDLETLEETYVSIPEITGWPEDNAVGIAVDTDTNLVYVTTGNQGSGGSDLLMVFDSDLNLLFNLTIGGSPTGLAIPTEDVSYNPLGLSKVASKDRVRPGGRVTFTISFDNSQNEFELTNVVIEDILPPGLDYVEASGEHVYDPETRRIRWVIECVEAGERRQAFTLVAKVTSNATKGSEIGNAVTVDSDQTPPTTQRSFMNVTGGFAVGLPGGPVVRDAIVVGGILVGSYVLGAVAAAGLVKAWLIPAGAELSSQMMLGSVVKYGILIVGALFAISQTHIEPAPVIVGAGVVGVALAFGARDIVANLVSGIIIVIDRPLKRGDVVEVEGAVGEVLDVGLRATAIRTLDNVNHLVPNTYIILRKITNYSKYDPKIRLQIRVRVAYGSDMEKAKDLVLATARAHPKVLKEPAPEVRMVEFGTSAIDLILFAWIEDPSDRFRIKDELNWGIGEEFVREGIRMSFPQKDAWKRE